MLAIIILSVSVLIQFFAAFYALRLIKISGKAYAWILISSALVFMGVRRFIPLCNLVFIDENFPIDMTNEVIGMVLSLLMLLGVIGIESIFIDRKRVEERIRKTNRELRVISDCNQALVRAVNEQSLLDDICQIVCEVAGYRMVWVGFAEQGKPERIRLIARNGEDEACFSADMIALMGTEKGGCPSVKVIQTGQICCIQDVMKEFNDTPLYDHSIQCGYRAIIALPLTDENGMPFGVICIYSNESDAFSSEEQRLLNELAGDLAFGIVGMRIRAEREQVKEQIEMLKHSIDVHYDGAYWMDSDNKFVYVNDAGCKSLGYTYEELIGKKVYDINSTATENRMKEVWARLRNEGCFSSESVHRRKDGSEFPVEIRATYVQFGGKEFNCGFAHDITERKRAEEFIRLLAQISDDAPASITVHDFEGNFLYANAETFRLHGYTREEFMAKNLHAIDAPQSEQLIANRMQAISEKGEADFDVQHFRKDGSTFSLHVNVKLIKWGDKKAMLSIASDLTERKQAEMALRQSEEKFKALFESAKDGIFLVSANGNIVVLNESFAKMHGYTVQEMLGMNLKDLDTSKDSQLAPERFQRTLAGEQLSFEVDHYCKNGQTIPLEVSANLVVLGGEKCILGFHRDISERKRAEEKLIASEIRYRRLFEAAKDGILILDAETGMVVDVNPFLIMMLGYSHDVFLGKKIWELGIFKDVAASKNNFMELQNKEYIRYEDLPLETADGRRINVEFVSNVYKVEHKKVIQCNVRDITVRKQMEEEVRHQRDFIQNVLKSIPDPFYVIDVNSYRIVMSNQTDIPQFSLCYAASHKSDTPCGRNGSGCVCPLTEIKKTFKPVIVEHIHKYGENESRIIEVHGYPIFDDAGNLHQVIEYCLDVTDRKNFEKALIESQLRYQALFKASSDAVYLLSVTENGFPGKIIDVNDVACKMLEYSKEEILKLSFQDIETFESKMDVPKIVDELTTGRHVLFEQTHKAKDGRQIPVEVHANMFLLHGEVVIISTVRDISERKRIEKALYENEEKYHSLFDKAKDAIFVADTQTGIILDCNHGAEILLGREKSEIVGLHQSALHPNAEKEKLTKSFKSHVMLGKAEEYEQIIRKDGTIIPVRISASVITIGGKKVMQGVFQDISQQVKLQNQIIKSEERFRSLTECFSDYIWEIDLNGIITYCSPQVEEHTGMKSSKICGMEITDFVIPEDKPLLEKLLKDYIQNPHPFKNFECRVNRQDAGITQISISGTPIFDDHKKLIGYRGINSDITQRKKLEEQLSHSEKMNAIGQLAGGIAHDFNNILQGIMLSAENVKIIFEKQNSEKGLKNTQNIIGCTDKARELINQLLTFSRKEKNITKPVDINKLINEIFELMLHTFDKRIYLKKVLTEHPCWLLGNQSQLQNMIINLVINSRDAMPEGGDLTIKTETVILDDKFCQFYPDLVPGNYVKISISDTGIGIAKENLQRIFDPFFTTKSKGTGLGLSSVFGSVKLHKGAIDVQSQVGKWTVFTVLLPEAEKMDIKNNNDSSAFITGCGRVLIVDDESMVLTVMSDSIKTMGYNVDAFLDSEESVDFYKSNYKNINLVILDLNMPKLTGLDVLREMKKVNSNVKAILVTGYADFQLTEEAVKEGIVSIIKKPVTVAELSEAIKFAI